LAKCFINGGKGKAISLQVWTGPEGSRRLRLINDGTKQILQKTITILPIVK
jgi:hypothetical protein